MGKIPAIRIKSDDCAVYVGRKIVGGKVTEPGTPYFVHKDEWVEIIPASTVGEYIAYAAIVKSASELPKVGDAAGNAKTIAVGVSTHDSFELIVQKLAARVIDWNWTDLEGQPMPKPHNNPAAIRELTVDEILWLLLCTESGEQPADRKNA